MEDFNTSTLPHRKYYNLEFYHQEKAARARKKGQSVVCTPAAAQLGLPLLLAQPSDARTLTQVGRLGCNALRPDSSLFGAPELPVGSTWLVHSMQVAVAVPQPHLHSNACLCRCTQVQEKTVFDDEAEVRRERAAKRAAEDAERLKGTAGLSYGMITLIRLMSIRLCLALAVSIAAACGLDKHR